MPPHSELSVERLQNEIALMDDSLETIMMVADIDVPPQRDGISNYSYAVLVLGLYSERLRYIRECLNDLAAKREIIDEGDDNDASNVGSGNDDDSGFS